MSDCDVFDPNVANYHTISFLSDCCNGTALVLLAKHKPTGRLVALKKINMDQTADEANLIQHEIILTRQLQHPNILNYMYTFVSGPHVCVVSPLMAFGSCKDLIKNYFTEGLPEPAIKIILKGVMEGLDYIHKRGYIHRAIRASHILISGSGSACLTGLRYACRMILNGKWQKSIHEFPETVKRNLNWLSPEMLEQGYNEKSDIYSVGITACELANGVVPYDGYAPTLMLTEKVAGTTPVLFDRSTFMADQADNNVLRYTDSGVGDSVASCSNMPSRTNAFTSRSFTDQFHMFVHLCLLSSPVERPVASELLTHCFFKNVRRSSNLAQLLHPVMPMSDRIADNPDDIASIEAAQKLSEMELNTCEWEF